MKKLNSIIWGIVLITVGIIVALNAMNITDINIFFDGWWSLFIIVPCAIGLFSEPKKTGNLIGLAIGVVLLLSCQKLIDFSIIWKLTLPAIIVIIGIKMILNAFFSNKASAVSGRNRAEGKQQTNHFAAFSGNHVNMDGQSFYGGELNAVFGGIEYDLRGALITQDCVINASAIFGGIDILLPDDVNVKVSSNSLFGGVGNKRKGQPQNHAVTIYINGTGLFGGVDVK